MKQLQKALQSAVKALNTLATKIEAISKTLEGTEKAKPAPAKKPSVKGTRKPAASKTVKKSAPKKAVEESAPKKVAAPTAADTILELIGQNEKGLNTATLIEKSGFNAKKVQNTVFRLRKQGRIKNAAKGIYVKG
jgi:hypothetical protein